MKIPAIEELRLHISDVRTRESIKEVLSCFYSDNMRSAVVMLYATVISDLYYKLHDLNEIYNDGGAKQILDYVTQEWENNKISPAWESEMPKRCHKQNKILMNDSYAHFQHLQTERNLCAHPAMDGSFNLYRPNAATVQGLILDMMTGVLCKPSFMSKELFNTFTDDIIKASDLFVQKDQLLNYIKAKYLDKINNEREEYDIFKKLWKLVFKATDETSINYRDASYNILELIFERHLSFIKGKVNEEKNYYSSQVNIEDKMCITEFIKFANSFNELYPLMSDEFKIAFETKINKNEKLKALAFCLDSDILLHAKNIDPYIGADIADYIYNYIKVNITEAEANDFAIFIYGKSPNYDYADNYYDKLITPILDMMTEEQLIKLIQVSNSNSQIHDRRQASASKFAIKRRLDEKHPEFDYTPYSNF